MTATAQQTALAGALEGDKQALGALLDSLRPYIRFLARALRRGRLASRLDDSDLIQDALVEIQRHFAEFRGASVVDFLCWLRPIVIRSTGHTLRAHLATAGRDAGREEQDADIENLVDNVNRTPSGKLIRQEEVVQLAEGLARLPEEMQQVLLGRHVDGVSYADLAERLQRSEGAVRILYTRALRRLRTECDPQT